MLKNVIIQLFIWATGTLPAQKFLEFVMRFSQFLMGIGSGGELYKSGEKTVFNVLKRKISAPYVIFDVGANRGQYLALIQSFIPITDCNIYCFEPSESAFKLLKQEATVSQNIHLNNIAISDYNGSGKLWFDKKGSELSSLTKRNLDHRNIPFTISETVIIQTLDSFCIAKGIDHINLLKIDIEGHEFQALQGAINMLTNKAIDMISFEFGASNIDSRFFFKDFYNFLLKQRMTLFRITPSGLLVKIKNYNEIYEQFRPTNYFAIAQRYL